jgi:hypothetical protein
MTQFRRTAFGGSRWRTAPKNKLQKYRKISACIEDDTSSCTVHLASRKSPSVVVARSQKDFSKLTEDAHGKSLKIFET